VGEEEVAEVLRLLFDAVKDEYPELLDDAAKLACKFLQAVGGLLRSLNLNGWLSLNLYRYATN
jgi:hypothetical protein